MAVKNDLFIMPLWLYFLFFLLMSEHGGRNEKLRCRCHLLVTFQEVTLFTSVRVVYHLHTITLKDR